MIRVASHFCFCRPNLILKSVIVEQNEDKSINSLFNLDEGNVEAANTVFHSGILSGEIISLKSRLDKHELDSISKEYQYIDLSETITDYITDKKKLIIDFGTNDSIQINRILKQVFIKTKFPIFEFIAACTYYPAIVLNTKTNIEANNKVNLLLWEGVDLINRKTTEVTQITNLYK